MNKDKIKQLTSFLTTASEEELYSHINSRLQDDPKIIDNILFEINKSYNTYKKNGLLNSNLPKAMRAKA